MDTIKQTSDKSCLACVLAMIIGESEQYVLDWFQYQDPPLCDNDAIIFLAHHGIFFSTMIPLNGEQMHPDRVFNVDFGLHGRAAYLAVKSHRFKEKMHAVFWDGYRIHDPSPEMPDNPPLSLYQVECFYPLMITQERQEFYKNLKYLKADDG